MKKFTSIAIIFLLLSTFLLGCGSNSKSQIDMVAPSMKEEANSSQDMVTSTEDVERKIVQTADVSIETKSFLKSIEGLEQSVNTIKGFIQSSSIQGTSLINNEQQYRTANYTLRIPSHSLTTYLSSLSSIGNITSKTTSNEDITEPYIDNEAHLKSLQVQEERILALLKQAKELKDILELEKELSRIRYEIESLTRTKQQFDKMIQYSTVSVNVIEVESLTEKDPTTLWHKIVKQFKGNLDFLIHFAQSFVIFFIGNLPILLILSVIGFILFYAIRKKKSHK